MGPTNNLSPREKNDKKIDSPMDFIFPEADSLL